MPQTIKLELSVEQVNLILAALAKQPFEAVVEIIGEVRKQAQAQVDKQPTVVEEVK
jgi:hypothetical protein